MKNCAHASRRKSSDRPNFTLRHFSSLTMRTVEQDLKFAGAQAPPVCLSKRHGTIAPLPIRIVFLVAS
jgi:hypothetical protein